jgi:hypothetical protein
MGLGLVRQHEELELNGNANSNWRGTGIVSGPGGTGGLAGKRELFLVLELARQHEELEWEGNAHWNWKAPWL